MECPKCCSKTFVYDTQSKRDGDVWRKRKCLNCQYRFTTIESVIPDKLHKKYIPQPEYMEPEICYTG